MALKVWVAENGRYYYTDTHPTTKTPWATMPSSLWAMARAIATQFGESDYEPQSCLVNIYQGTKQSLGLHQDNSEKRLDRMIISISLGASGIFCLGGFERKGSLQKFLLNSGDVFIMSGCDRLRFHSFKGNVAPAPYGFLKGDLMTRINLTIRQVF